MPNALVRLSRAYRLGVDERGRRIRERTGVSLRELAEAIGTNPGELSRWERGLAKPRKSAALRWYQAVEALGGELARDDATKAAG